MARAPWLAGIVFGLALALLITLVGPLLLFNPVFTSALQARHGVADAFDTTQAEVDRVTREVLVDLYLDGPFVAAFEGREPLLDARERSHMHDVAVLVRQLALAVLLAAIAAAVTGWWLRREPRRRGRIMIAAAGAVGVAALLLALTFVVTFEAAFLAFHAIFFPPDSFLFEPGSNLITLFPEGFWFDASLAAGAAIILAAVLVTLLGLRAARGATPT
jgi:integral membrane protein (TIGR01906 family)